MISRLQDDGRRRTAVAIRHIEFGDFGSFGQTLVGRGFDLCCIDAGSERFDELDPLAPDVLALMGGPFGANDEAEYPFVLAELEMVRRRIDAGRPTIGICLGAQLMARALGGRVCQGPGVELGWGPISLTEAGMNGCLAPLADERVHVLHWHGDTFELPSGATLLASTAQCRNQAFSIGSAGLALQFHPEVDERSMYRWLDHPGIAAWLREMDEAEQHPVGYRDQQLKAGGDRHGRLLASRAAECLDRWLSQNEDI